MSMSEVDAFLDRIDRMATEQVHNEGGDEVPDGTDESLTRNGQVMKPFLERLAERAGVELADVRDACAARIAIPVGITESRLLRAATDDERDVAAELPGELAQLAVACGLQMFLAGAAWEQWRTAPPELRELS